MKADLTLEYLTHCVGLVCLWNGELWSGVPASACASAIVLCFKSAPNVITPCGNDSTEITAEAMAQTAQAHRVFCLRLQSKSQSW